MKIGDYVRHSKGTIFKIGAFDGDGDPWGIIVDDGEHRCELISDYDLEDLKDEDFFTDDIQKYLESNRDKRIEGYPSYSLTVIDGSIYESKIGKLLWT